MPYVMRKRGAKWCVYNKTTGENKGCSDTPEMGKKHLAALYAAENKEMDTKEIDALVEKCMGEMGVFVPYPITSFSDYEAWEKQEELAHELQETTVLYKAMIDNILYNPEITDKASAITSLTAEYGSRIASPETDDKEKIAPVQTGQIVAEGSSGPEIFTPDPPSFFQRVKEAVVSIFGLKPKESEPSEMEIKERGSVMLWKEADGMYHWLARYSNKWRDRDNPPEILASGAHQTFAEKVDKGLAPLPKLWLWHRPEYEWGEAKSVFYDDTGFALATGIVYPGCESIAESIAALAPDQIRVSHGMPKKSIVRDPSDPSIIVEYETREISPLPAWAAANELTGFYIYEEGNMPVPKEKRQELIDKWGIKPEMLDRLETDNIKAAEEAASKGIESKEQELPVTETPAETPVETPAVETAAETTDPQDQPPSRKEIAEALATYLQPMVEEIATLKEQNAELLRQLAEKSKTEEQKIAEKAQTMPTASLVSMIAQSVIGASEARLDGRETLAKSRPAETPPAPLPGPHDRFTGIVANIIKESTHSDPA